MDMMNHARTTVYEQITAGQGINRRIKLGLANGEAALIQAIYFDEVGTSMIQGVSTDPDKTGVISNDEVKKAKDVLVYTAQANYEPKYFPPPGFPVVQDLLYMVDIVFTGSLDYGVHVLYFKKPISIIEELALLVKRR